MHIIDPEEDLVKNPSSRIPLVFCLDVSGSMKGEKIETLNTALAGFYDVLRKDSKAKLALDVSIVTFDNRVNVSQFKSVRMGDIPKIDLGGGQTYLGSAVERSLELLKSRKREYKKNNLKYYQPILLIMTDGWPEGEPDEAVAAAAKKTRSLEAKRKLTVIPYFIGSEETERARKGLKVLSEFSSINEPQAFPPPVLASFFRWLSASVAYTAAAGLDESRSVSLNDFVPFYESVADLL